MFPYIRGLKNDRGGLDVGVLATLLQRLRRGQGSNTLRAGIAISDDGVAVALMESRPAGQSLLKGCRFIAAANKQAAVGEIALLAKEFGLNKIPTYSVLTDGCYDLLMADKPEVEATELRSALRWQLKDRISFPLDEAVFDLFEIPVVEGRRAQKRLLYVVVSKQAEIERHVAALQQAHILLQVIDIPEMALRNLAALLPDNSMGVAMLRIGRHGGLLTLIRGGELYLTRRIGVGLDQIAERQQRIQQRDELVLADEGGVALEIRELLDQIVLEVQRTLDYYTSAFSMPAVTQIVLAPMEQPVPGMMSYLSSSLGIPVQVLNLNHLIESDSALSEPLQAQILTAIGMALRVDTPDAEAEG